MNFLLIDKPSGWTSFDVVAYIRKGILRLAQNDSGDSRLHGNDKKKIKVGHAGTLDPFATGLLIVGVGREATKRLDEFKGLPKIYIATIRLGAVSDTDDIDGKITPTPIDNLTIQQFNNKKFVEEINSVLKSFLGPQQQIPPMYSAKKINGKKLYELARKGITIERQPSEIEIYEIKLLAYSWPVLKIEVRCSTGTYIRSLAHDIGLKLGTGAYCAALIRTAIGDYKLENAQKLA